MCDSLEEPVKKESIIGKKEFPPNCGFFHEYTVLYCSVLLGVEVSFEVNVCFTSHCRVCLHFGRLTRVDQIFCPFISGESAGRFKLCL